MQNRFPDKVPIYYGFEGFDQLTLFLQSSEYSKLFVLVDNNTENYCLPILERAISLPYISLKITPGEINKNLDTCQIVWQKLTEQGADRQSIVLNLGGGVLTDMGGFVAASYKRGISFINIPTTLLGMIDAAIGGKTGIDFNRLKNQIGLFVNPEMILVYPEFLKTLPKPELLSGFAEVIKYGLIDDFEIWKYVKKQEVEYFEIEASIIQKSAKIKERIVKEDPKEKGIRKILNFGHTLGHAIETYFLSKPKNQQILHGEAVAIGMVLAAHLSHQTQGLSIKITNEIADNTLKFYADRLPKKIEKSAISVILKLLKHDKKNIDGNINFVLLKAIGKPVLDCRVTRNEIISAFDFYACKTLSY